MDFLNSWTARACQLVRSGAIALTLVAWPAALPAGDSANEYELKAAFLYKFASFVAWPDSNSAEPLCIGVVGQDPFGQSLDEVVKGKSFNGRAFEVRRFGLGQDTGKCQILFISAPEKKKLRAALDRLAGVSALTVGDMPGFCESGGVVRLGLEDNRVRMEINPDAAERAGLQLSSKLLSLAKVIRVALNR